MDEQTTIQLVLSGDDAAYGILIEQHQWGLIRFCFTITHDADQAEDIAQEAFIRAYNQLSNYDPSFRFSTWLYRIARNLALNHIRLATPLPLDGQLELQADNDHTQTLDREAREAQVRWAVDQLPEHYRSVIHLHYWDHQPYVAIAAVMGIPESTVKSWLYRARQQLKETCHGIIN